MEKLNLPIELIERYKTSKTKKELLAFSIAIKCFYSNSVLTNISIKKIMNILHVSNAKAKLLLQEAKNDSHLFFYNKEYNNLRANTYKSNHIKTAKNGLTYISDFCYKIEKKNYTINELYKLINEVLIKNAINAVDRDNFTQSKPITHRCAGRDSLTQKKLGNIAGLSRQSAARITNKLAAKGTISKTRAVAKMVIPHVNDITVSEWQKKTGLKNFIHNHKDGSGWIIQPCLYSIEDRSESERFKHVIFNHNKRTSSFNRSTKVSNIFDLPVMGIFF